MLTCYRHLRMRARDTSAKAEALQDELHRMLGPEGRFQLAVRLSELAREFAKAGVREKHPEYTEAQLQRELANTLFGLKLP